MYEPVLVILALIIVVIFSILLIKFLIQYLKRDLEITRYAMIAIYSLSFGILYDSARIFMFIFWGGPDPATDRFLFALKFFLIFVGIAAIIRIVFILSRQSGHAVKYGAFIRYALFGVIGVISAINLFTFESKILPDFSDFYTYEINEILFFSVVSISIPAIIVLSLKLNLIFKEIRDKRMKKQLIILIFIFVILIIERYYSMAHELAPYSIDMLVVEFSLITFIALFSFSFFFKYPDLLEILSTYFCVKAIYIIKKKSGQLLFGYDFQGEGAQDFSNPENLLLGGFIYAISRGLEITLNLSGDLELIEIKNNYLLFKQGKYVVGLVFATENLTTTSLKLLLFLQKFERTYETVLKNWTGDLSEFHSEIVMNWIYEIFRTEKK